MPADHHDQRDNKTHDSVHQAVADWLDTIDPDDDPGNLSENSVDPDGTPIDAPMLHAVKLGNGKAMLLWTKIDGAESYTVTSDPDLSLDDVDAPPLTVEIDDDTPTTFSVAANGSEGTGPDSNEVVVVQTADGAPFAKSNALRSHRG